MNKMSKIKERIQRDKEKLELISQVLIDISERVEPGRKGIARRPKINYFAIFRRIIRERFE